jgi:hypothetical protein
MSTTQSIGYKKSNDARICLFSQRHLQKLLSRCVSYEFESVISQIDDVDLLAPEPYRLFPIGRKIANRLAKHTSITFVNPGVRKLQLEKDYDLFIATVQFPADLLTLNALKGWKERCQTSVCYLEEIWVDTLGKSGGRARIKMLSQFDYVVLNCSMSVKPVRDKIRKPCIYLPPGVDAIRFCPYPNPPRRCVDVFNLGRRSPVTHTALLKMAEEQRIFYLYDTISFPMNTDYPMQHRGLIANKAKRSRYFISNAAKSDRQFETRGQSEIGFRFFEGASAGTVMIGEPPQNDAFKKYFDWPDAVIHVPYDTEDIAEILADLDSQPQRLAEIRKNNVIHSLLRHDWVYRWRAILDIVGLEPRPALFERERQLKELAEIASKQS